MKNTARTLYAGFAILGNLAAVVHAEDAARRYGVRCSVVSPLTQHQGYRVTVDGPEDAVEAWARDMDAKDPSYCF